MLLGGMEENSIPPDEGSLICPPGKIMSFHKRKQKKIDLVARPDVGHGPSGDRDGRVGMQSVGFVVGTGFLEQKERC